MSTGMEKMLASMLGITPEQMKDTINEAVNLLGTISEKFERMENRLDKIAEKLGVESEIKNDGENSQIGSDT